MHDGQSSVPLRQHQVWRVDTVTGTYDAEILRPGPKPVVASSSRGEGQVFSYNEAAFRRHATLIYDPWTGYDA